MSKLNYHQKIFPFAVEEPEGKQVERDLELAITICLTEEKRKKKAGIFGGAPEKVVFFVKALLSILGSSMRKCKFDT